MVGLEKKLTKQRTYLFNIKLVAVHTWHKVGETLLLAMRVLCELNLDIHDTTNYLCLSRSEKRKWIFFFSFEMNLELG